MKKVLALILAVAMLSTVAFAADYVEGKTYAPDGTEIGVSSADFGTDADDLNTKNYSIKKVTDWTGKAYVKSMELDDDEGDELTITLIEDYKLDKVKEVKFTVELKGKGKDVEDAKKAFSFKVGYDPMTIAINKDNDIDKDIVEKYYNETILKFKSEKDDNGKVVGAPYGDLEFDTTDGDTSVSVRVYDGDKFYLGHDYDADKKVLVANADSDAVISFLNFPAKPSFNSTATVYFYDVDEDGFVYELTGEGKIKKSAAKWSEDDGCWVLKTRTLGSYVFSDKALTSAAAADATDSTTNPDTGANDVVGIATALAVVSLVAAGAVSLKK